MPQRLTDLTITANALVDKGDNPGAQIVFTKRAEAETEESMDFDAVLKSLDEDAQKVITDRIAELTKRLEDTETETETETEVEVPEQFAKAHDEMRKRLEASETALAAEIEKRQRAEFAKRAEGINLGIEVGELGEVLRKLAGALDDAEYGKVEAAMRAAGAVRDEAGATLTKTVGTAAASGEDGSTAHDRLMSKAREMAADKDLSIAVAYAKAAESNPELYRLAKRGE